MKKLIIAAITLTFSLSTIADDDKYVTKKTEEKSGTEVTKILKELIPGVTDYGSFFVKGNNKAAKACAILLTTAGNSDDFSEVKVVDHETFIPTKATFWFAKGVKYTYLWEDYGFENGGEKNFYVRHTFKPVKSDKYTVVVDQAGDAGIDISLTIDKADKELEALCQFDF